MSVPLALGGIKNSPVRVACLLKQKTDLKACGRGSARKIERVFVGQPFQESQLSDKDAGQVAMWAR